MTQQAYSGIAAPEAGSLYFITDNGEIRKGSQHITGVRVYTAVDSTNGATPLASLAIKLNGNTPGANDQPKKGDVLVVDQTLKAGVAAQGTEGQEGYVPAVPAVIAKAAYVHNGTDWEACDGNVDASKVILTNDITMAGNYDKIGNFTKTTAGTNKNFLDGGTSTSGVSVYELIRQMLSKTLEPTWQRNPPTASISASSAGTKEYGEPASTTFTATLNDAYAKFTGGSNQMAGCTVDTNGYKFDGAEEGQAGNTKSKNWTAGVAAAPSASVTITYKASTNTMKNNLNEASTSINPQSIAAGTTASVSTTAAITVIRKWFYGVDTVGTATIDSAFIRGLTNGGNCETATNKQFVVGSGAKRIVIAIPQKDANDSCVNDAKTLKNVFLVSASNTPLEISASTTTGYKKLASAVQVADYRGGDNGKIAYDVWVYQPASISPTEEHNIVIG